MESHGKFKRIPRYFAVSLTEKARWASQQSESKKKQGASVLIRRNNFVHRNIRDGRIQGQPVTDLDNVAAGGGQPRRQVRSSGGVQVPGEPMPSLSLGAESKDLSRFTNEHCGLFKDSSVILKQHRKRKRAH